MAVGGHHYSQCICARAHRFFSREGSGWARELHYAPCLVGSGGQAEKVLGEGLEDFTAQLPDQGICSRAKQEGKGEKIIRCRDDMQD